MKSQPFLEDLMNAVWVQVGQNLEQADLVQKELQNVGKILQQDPQLLQLMEGTGKSLTDHLLRIQRVLGETLHPLTKEALLALIQENALGQVTKLAELLEEKRRKQGKGRLANVTTAVPLNQEEREHLLNLLTERWQVPIVLEEQLDPSILGGLWVESEDWFFDGSTRARLERLRHSLVS